MPRISLFTTIPEAHAAALALLACAGVSGCGALPIEHELAPAGVFEGTVIYSGPLPCTEDGHVLTITYEKLLEIYFQNPQFGYYFLVLTSRRLLENISRLEGIIAQTAGPQAAASSDIA